MGVVSFARKVCGKKPIDAGVNYGEFNLGKSVVWAVCVLRSK